MTQQKEDPLLENKFVFDNSYNGPSYTDAEIKAILEENYKYSKEYNELRKQEGNQLDAVHQYRRSWLQTINLAMASVVLGVLIYKQK